MGNIINTGAGGGNINNNPNIDVDFLDPQYDPPCYSDLRVEDSLTISFSGSGSTCDPLSASVILSTRPGNSLIIFNDGLYASGSSEDVFSVFGRTGAIVANVSDYSAFYYPLNSNPAGYLTSAPAQFISGVTNPLIVIGGNLSLKISATVGNILQSFSDGLFVSGSTPSSPLTSIQFNNGGSFGGTSSFVWDNSNKTVVVTTPATTNTVVDSFIAKNTGVSTSGLQQYGGAYYSIGSSFNVSSKGCGIRWYNKPTGGMGQTSNLVFESSLNGGAYTQFAQLSDVVGGQLSIKNVVISSGGFISSPSIVLDGGGTMSPIRIVQRSLLSSPVAGTIEADANHLYFTTTAGPNIRYQLDQQTQFISGVTNPLIVTGGVLSVNVSAVAGNSLVVLSDGLYTSGNTIANIRTSTNLAETFGVNDYTLLIDSTAGNANINLDPTILNKHIGNIKKISSDTNTITLTATSGLIYYLGPPTSTMVFDGQGENIEFHIDGVNIYIQ